MTRALALLVLAAGFSPFRAPDAGVAAGNARYEAGDPAAALRQYRDAEGRLGSRAELDHDCGTALYRLGRFAEAREAFERALANPRGDRPGRTRYDLGEALAAAGDDEGAIAAFTRALAEDPGDQAARHNLEVLLRRKQEGRAGSPPKPPPSAPHPSPSPAGQARSKSPPPPGKGPGSEDGSASRPPSPTSSPPRGAGAAPESPAPANRDGEAGGPAAERRAEAIRLLDAVRSREKNLPMWPAREARERSRADAAQDW